MWKRIFLILLTATLLWAVVACDKPTSDPLSNTDTDAEETTAEPVSVLPLELVSAGSGNYTVIYPEGAASTLMAGVNELVNTIKTYTGATLTVQDDYIGATQQETAREILIGKTNREASTAAWEQLRKGEYAITVDGDKLILCGVSDTETVAAVNYLIDLIKSCDGLSAGTENGSLIFSPDEQYQKMGTYYIQSLQINGKSISAYRIVVPKEGYVEWYIAKLLAQYLQTYSGYMVEVVTDEEPTKNYEILIGKTNRTSAIEAPTAGSYRIAVTEKGLEALASSDYGYLDILDALQKNIIKYTQSAVSLQNGNIWDGTETAYANTACQGTLRIMYHNVWGYLNADGSNPMANRSDIAISVYERYAPDILCMQEAGPYYRNNSTAMVAWLAENYTEICYSSQGGSGNPIFYRNETLELVESGYEKSRNGDKGTTWAVFRERATGSLFAVTNSHFAANTNAGDDPTLGNTYRMQDAQTVVNVCTDIVSKYGSITVFSGGDFNCMIGNDPYAILTTNGYRNIRDETASADAKSPYHGSYAYNEELEIYPLQSRLPYDSSLAIDHIMTTGSAATVHCYNVLDDRLALTTSDHAPHFIDITLPQN